MTAPENGSGDCPAWMALVEKPIFGPGRRRALLRFRIPCELLFEVKFHVFGHPRIAPFDEMRVDKRPVPGVDVRLKGFSVAGARRGIESEVHAPVHDEAREVSKRPRRLLFYRLHAEQANLQATVELDDLGGENPFDNKVLPGIPLAAVDLRTEARVAGIDFLFEAHRVSENVRQRADPWRKISGHTRLDLELDLITRESGRSDPQLLLYDGQEFRVDLISCGVSCKVFCGHRCCPAPQERIKNRVAHKCEHADQSFGKLFGEHGEMLLLSLPCKVPVSREIF